ncbi:MAG: OmpA family protein [Bacteroidota bacterium]|nr:OmpA family protein [Bacteroidota bacterium]
MNFQIKHLINLLIIITIISSCVPAKQFEELNNNYLNCNEKLDLLKDENKNLNISNTELDSKYKLVKNKLSKLQKDSINHEVKIRNTTQKYDKLNRQYNNLQNAQEQLLKGNAKETKRLLVELQNTQGNLQNKEDKLLELKSNLRIEQNNLRELQKELEARNASLVDLEKILRKKDSTVKVLKNNVSNALLGFTNSGLQVKQKNGKVYVSLDEKLLFKSGSTVVDPKGEKALKKLAKVLEQNKNINIMVEGHTDDKSYIPDEAIKDNWDLSVKRATAIVRILMKNSSIKGKRIIASGRSKYLPIDPAKTDIARRKNRRTEIILSPKLDELLKVLESN